MQKRKLSYLLGVAGIVLLSGCSTVSDSYNSASSWILGEENADEISAEKPRGKTGRSVTAGGGVSNGGGASSPSSKEVSEVSAKPSGKNSGLSINSDGGQYEDSIKRDAPVASAPKKAEAQVETVVKKPEAVKVEPVPTVEAKAPVLQPPPPRAPENVDQVFRRRLEESWRQSITPDMNGMQFNLGRGGAIGPQSSVMPEGTGGVVQASYGAGPAGALATTISFANGSTKVSGASSAQLKKVAALYRQYGGPVKVVGHASSRTRDMEPVKHIMANMNISLSRAQAVAKELVKYGVPANMIKIEGASDSNPVIGDEDMPSLEAVNRRVEVYFGS